jgi:hypothetical protein
VLGRRVQAVSAGLGADQTPQLGDAASTWDGDSGCADRSAGPGCRRPDRLAVAVLVTTVVERLGDAPSLRYLLPLRPLRRWVLRCVVRESLEAGRGWTDPTGRSVVIVDPALEEQEPGAPVGSWRVALELATGILAVVGVAGTGLVLLVGWLFGWLAAIAAALVVPVAMAWRPVRVWRAERTLGRGVRSGERYVHDVARARDAPPGSARPLLAAVCAVADSDGRALVLEADQPALVKYYASFGFAPVAVAAMPWRGTRTLLVREPRAEPEKVVASAEPVEPVVGGEGRAGVQPVAAPLCVRGAPADPPRRREPARVARPLDSSRPWPRPRPRPRP